MSVSKQIDVLVMYYLTSHQALEFILGWLTVFFIETSIQKYLTDCGGFDSRYSYRLAMTRAKFVMRSNIRRASHDMKYLYLAQVFYSIYQLQIDIFSAKRGHAIACRRWQMVSSTIQRSWTRVKCPRCHEATHYFEFVGLYGST